MFKRVAFVQLANSFVSGLVSKIYQTMSICTMTLETVWKIYPRRWHLNGNSYSKRLFRFKLDFIPICWNVLILLKYDLMHHLSLYFDSKVYIFETTALIPEVEYETKILTGQYIANSSWHWGSYGSIWTGPSPQKYMDRSFWGPYNIFLVTDRSIYCHMTRSDMNYLLYYTFFL